MAERCYIAIDLKSFYASVEARDRNLDPLRFNLVVADPTRTEKTICLAVSPSLKAYGIPGRARLFEVVQRVKEVKGCFRRVKTGSIILLPHPATRKPLPRTPRWSSPISRRRPRCGCMRRSPPKSSPSTRSTSARTTSMSIPSTSASWM